MTVMFTGIVSEIGTVIGVTERNDVRRIAIACNFVPDSIAVGASIACAGICMTVIGREDAGAGSNPKSLSAPFIFHWPEKFGLFCAAAGGVSSAKTRMVLSVGDR